MWVAVPTPGAAAAVAADAEIVPNGPWCTGARIHSSFVEQNG